MADSLAFRRPSADRYLLLSKGGAQPDGPDSSLAPSAHWERQRDIPEPMREFRHQVAPIPGFRIAVLAAGPHEPGIAFALLVNGVSFESEAAVAGRHAVEDAAAATTLKVRRHPLLSVGLAAGVGALAGCLVGFAAARRCDRRG